MQLPTRLSHAGIIPVMSAGTVSLPLQRPRLLICRILPTTGMEYSKQVDRGAVLRVPALSFTEGPALSIVEGTDFPGPPGRGIFRAVL